MLSASDPLLTPTRTETPIVDLFDVRATVDGERLEMKRVGKLRTPPHALRSVSAMAVPVAIGAPHARRYYKASLLCERSRLAIQRSQSVSLAAHLEARGSVPRRARSREKAIWHAKARFGRPAWWDHFTEAPPALRRTTRGILCAEPPPLPPCSADVVHFQSLEVAARSVKHIR